MNKLLAISFCAMLLATACNSSEEPKPQAVAKKVEAVQPAAAVVEQNVATITTVDWNKAFEMNKAGAVLIDVRTPAEVAKGMASAAAINIPLQEMPQRLGEFPKDKDLLIYCRSGKRSMAASKFLVEKGFTRVFNVEGGILAFPPQN
ncbi:sulfurtransferase [Fibrobacter sp. UWB2]|uniref:rhodanese-like domain-containing protein n=1 Tax=Fibrobacter sp. UWB2 TaxID=1964358 RepID=UPI000B527E4E|nr:rhodanese-like domain-containing protein [Fibrobacter sp. UWB2]OWV24564.1 sulfurtransferase [Fibrobacter sp. UWB2]